MPFLKKSGGFKKHLAAILILAIILPSVYFSFPKKTDAILGIGDIVSDIWTEIESTVSAISNPVTATNEGISTPLNIAQHLKTWVLDPMAMMLAKMMIQDITASTVNWINSGFNGNPAYVQNPELFFSQLGDMTAAQYLSSNSWIVQNLCSPFQAKIQLAMTNAYLKQTSQYSCSLGKIENNFNNFTNDFTQGGWDTWFNVTQNTQSNPYGAFNDAQDRLAIQIGTAQNHYQTQLNQGNGFLSWETCKTAAQAGVTTGPSLSQLGAVNTASGISCPSGYFPNPTGTCVDNSGNPAPESAILLNAISVPPGTDTSIPTPAGVSNCPYGTQVNTPGSVIQQQLATTLGSTVNQLGVAQSINQIVGALMVQLVKQVVGGAGSLFGASQSSAGSPSLQSQIIPTSAASTAQFNAQQSQITSTEQNVMTQASAATSAAVAQATPTVPPSITLLAPNNSGPSGSDPSNPMIWPLGTPWQDPGYVAADPTDGDITSEVVVGGDDITDNVNNVGTYTITYNVTDSQGLSAPTVTRTVSIPSPSGTQ
jgi:hypothetical protein